MPSAPLSAGYGTLVVLVLLIAASVWLGTVAQKVVERGSFMKGYFLGNRGLGAWALALTATVQSGGTFMGFPSLVYSFGWIVALWIAGYMVVPITGFGVLGKRMAQLSRRTGAITVPDLFRERFGSAAVGIVSSLFIMLFMSFMMVAQFKAGALIMKVSWPGSGALSLAEDAEGGLDRYYYVGLAIFSLTVVGYTLIGGFLAAVWTDLFQSIMMFVGVVLLLFLVVPAAGRVANPPANVTASATAPQPTRSWTESMEHASRVAAEKTGPGFVFGPGYSTKHRDFLPVGLAFSFFFVWVFAGVGSPASIVRIMASKDTPTMRRSIFLLNAYNAMIYVPLVIICICARAMIPDLPPGKTDEIIPRLAITTTDPIPGGSFLAGLILTAPFGAVMATVSGYLVVIASGLVRDVYQKFIHPEANPTEIRRVTYMVMIVVGLIALAANIKPVDYLQAIVVFSGTSAAATFSVTAIMTAFWRRATAAGALASMLLGAGTMLALYSAGWILSWTGYDQMIGTATKFRPYFLLGLDPIVWGLAASLVAGIVVSLCTRPPNPERVSLLFNLSTPAAT